MWLKWNRGHFLAYCNSPGWCDDCGAIDGMNDGQGKSAYSEKPCPNASLSTTNPTWLDSGSNPGRRGGKPATNRLSYDTAIQVIYVTSLSFRAMSGSSYSTDKGSRTVRREIFAEYFKRIFWCWFGGDKTNLRESVSNGLRTWEPHSQLV
jgi:hypothetical protein